jgi:hypothetical protein
VKPIGARQYGQHVRQNPVAIRARHGSFSVAGSSTCWPALGSLFYIAKL